jgi:hypothetical protein
MPGLRSWESMSQLCRESLSAFLDCKSETRPSMIARHRSKVGNYKLVFLASDCYRLKWQSMQRREKIP